MSTKSPKYFYASEGWDEPAWLDIVSVEYESLVSAFPFDAIFREISREGRLKVLDVGCGSAIFPQYLDQTLSAGTRLTCDLLDISALSLHQARETIARLQHFQVANSIETSIEDIPAKLSDGESRYEAIWAIHSFTTVDVERMADVYQHLCDLLTPSGRLLIYQFTADSAYQTLHKHYRKQMRDVLPPFMEFEDTARILQSLGKRYEVLDLHFRHELPDDRPELIDNYLKKCVLDESIEPAQVFADLLPQYHHDGVYRIPQSVNFVTVFPTQGR